MYQSLPLYFNLILFIDNTTNRSMQELQFLFHEDVNLLRSTIQWFYHVLYFPGKCTNTSGNAIPTLNFSICHHKGPLFRWKVSWESFIGVISYPTYNFLENFPLDDSMVNYFNYVIVIVAFKYMEFTFYGYTDGRIG